MKNFLTLTLVLFLSLFMVGESRATHGDSSIPNKHNVIQDGEIIAEQHRETPFNDNYNYFDLLIRYKGQLYWCQVSWPNDPYLTGTTYCHLYDD